MYIPALTAEVARALTSLKDNEDWKTVIAFLEEVQAEQDKRLRFEQGTALTQGQGSAQMIAFLLDNADKAMENWARFRVKQLSKEAQEARQNAKQPTR